MKHKRGLFFLFIVLFVCLLIGSNKLKKREGFINYDEYMPHIKKIHSQFRMNTTYKVKEYTEYFHEFLRNWYIIY